MLRRSLLTCAGFWLAAGQATAAPLVFEDFGGISDGKSAGTSGSGSVGWTGSWSDTNATAGEGVLIKDEAAWSNDGTGADGGITRSFTENAGSQY